MDRELIERLACDMCFVQREGGARNRLQLFPGMGEDDDLRVLLEDFAALIAEQCAQAAEDDPHDTTMLGRAARQAAAERIRAKFPPPRDTPS